jgi:cbb3-type cytochrome oxidase maturation protein
MTSTIRKKLSIFLFLQTRSMSVIIIMLVGSLIISLGFLIAFLWNVKDKQYEDDYSPSRRILFDDTKIEDKPI